MICGPLGKLYDRIKSILFHAFIRLFVLPIIDRICPIVDIRCKYLMICNDNEQNVLTIDKWDSYVEYLREMKKLQKVNESNTASDIGDYFDHIIIQKIAKLNRIIKMEISNSRGVGKFKRMNYPRFLEILESELGKSINFRYRYTRDSQFFESIMRDDSPYRRFKWCDQI